MQIMLLWSWYYVGFDMADLSERDKEKIVETEDFKNMPVYPVEGSIQKFDNIWGVKICE